MEKMGSSGPGRGNVVYVGKKKNENAIQIHVATFNRFQNACTNVK